MGDVTGNGIITFAEVPPAKPCIIARDSLLTELP